MSTRRRKINNQYRVINLYGTNGTTKSLQRLNIFKPFSVLGIFKLLPPFHPVRQYPPPGSRRPSQITPGEINRKSTNQDKPREKSTEKDTPRYSKQKS